jgi:signal transduction histidine kinase
MRIRYKVALVGGIPIVIAAVIALIAWLLLGAAERTREGAVLAGAVYRDLLGVTFERNEYLRASAAERPVHSSRLADFASNGLAKLDALAEVDDSPTHRSMVVGTRNALVGYQDQMWRLMQFTIRNDRLISEMSTRAASLIEMTDKARERQHASNTDIIASLAESDRKLRFARDIVDRAYELQAAVAAAVQHDSQVGSGAASPSSTAQSFQAARLRNASSDLAQRLEDDGRAAAADELRALIRAYEAPARLEQDPSAPAAKSAYQRLADWVERIVKVHSTEQRALHEEAAQLLTYSVHAAETEQVTQNVAIESLKLDRRVAEALAGRDVAEAAQVLKDSEKLRVTVATLPISPLIQAEMIEAIDRWREGLETTAEGLAGQNRVMAAMDSAAGAMIQSAGDLNELFTSEADRIGQVVRTTLLLGAAIGLLLGSGTALLVARSITEPLRSLKEKMIELAANPTAGSIAEAARGDELGSMAKAVNFFVEEIGRREDALRRAKNRADATLAELRETQSNLIQAEKLASLGQLVAGVAHEINTPLGVALTTATTLEREVGQVRERAKSGRLARSDFDAGLSRLGEGTRLLVSNLTRAIDLVYGFKQVAVDQASGERRRFELSSWLNELLTSLGPLLRKSGHEVAVECPSDLELDSYPGSLGQVLTNLIMNAIVHAYPAGASGRLTITVAKFSQRVVRIVFADNGKGIAPEHIGKIFDPFFTTGRDRGSTGLGLHIVYNLVTAKLQGVISVESRPGEGARFTIDVPLTVSEASPGPTLASEERVA